MPKIRHLFLILAIPFLIYSNALFATHIRGGEITAEKISTTSLSYRITVTGYTDTGSSVKFGEGELDFGDGNKINLNTDRDFYKTQDVGNNVAVNIFEKVYTYSSPGVYTISFFERNRNNGVLNITYSVEAPFYIETELIVEPAISINNYTPYFSIPIGIRALKGKKFVYNVGALEKEGDSLSYKLVPCKQSKNEVANNFRYPSNEEFYENYNYGNEARNGPPELAIDSSTGDLVWDAPGIEGEYNIAIMVEEWRNVGGKCTKMGFVVRDMQIVVNSGDNTPPVLNIDFDSTLQTGSKFTALITAADKEKDYVTIKVYSDLFSIPNNPAQFSYSSMEKDSLLIEWTPEEINRRNLTYKVYIVAADYNEGFHRPSYNIKTLTLKYNNGSVFCTADTITGVNEEIKNKSFKVFPNPAKDRIFISELELDINRKVNISIYNTLGTCVFSDNLLSSRGFYEVNLGDFKAGLYILRIESERKIYSKIIEVF